MSVEFPIVYRCQLCLLIRLMLVCLDEYPFPFTRDDARSDTKCEIYTLEFLNYD
jgi:hypothetical protein